MNQREIENAYIIIGLFLMIATIGSMLIIDNPAFKDGQQYQQCVNNLTSGNSYDYSEEVAKECSYSLGTHRR